MEPFHHFKLRALALLVLAFLLPVMGIRNFWLVICVVPALWILWQNRRELKREYLITGAVFGIIVALSNLRYGIVTFLAYAAGMTFFEDRALRIPLYGNPEVKNELPKTLLAIFGVGGIQAVINIYWGKILKDQSIGISFRRVRLAFRTGLFEEIVFRMFLAVLLLWLIDRHAEKLSKSDNLFLYLAMIVPHAMIHVSFNDPMPLPILTFFYFAIVIGLPYAIMQRKLNLTSAIGAHTLVVLVRYIYFNR